MGTALTERQLKELQRLTRRLYLCFDADAAGEEATLRGMELATDAGLRRPRRRRCRRARIRPTRRRASRSGSAARRATSSTASGSSSSARPTGRRRSCARARCCAQGRGLAGAAGRAAAARGHARPAAGDARRAGAEGADVRTLDGSELSPKMLEKGERLERRRRSRRASLHPALVHAARRALGRALRLGAPPPLPRRTWSTAGEEDERARRRCAPSSTRAPRARRLDERTGKELLLRLRERRLRRELAGAELER